MKLLTPQLVCSHGTRNCPSSEQETLVILDSTEGRSVGYWLDQIPPGVSFSVVLWPRGWGVGESMPVLRHQTSELEALDPPPVAGTAPMTVRVRFPHGAVRQAMLTPIADGRTYQMHARLFDSIDVEAWELLVPSKMPAVLPVTPVMREILKRRLKSAGGGDGKH